MVTSSSGQMVLLTPALATRPAGGEIVHDLVTLQPFVYVTSSAYEVVREGLASGFAQSVQLSPSAGDQA